jgi:uncharacterized protein YggU (UPF0235/DUF167 family)
VALSLRVTPKAGADRIEGRETLADGRAVLRVRVAAVPDRGRANAAVIALLAEALGVPRRAIGLATGETARLKTLHIDGETAVLGARLDVLAAPKGREIRKTGRN